MATKTYQVKPLSMRADFQPSSWSEDARTVDVVFATERPVQSYDWEVGSFMEVLSMDPGAMRRERMEQGLPVLNNHQRFEGVNGVLGVAENFRFENGQGIATIRFSNREEITGVIQDVRDGILKGISVGYRVHKYDLVSKAEGELPVYRATDWEPMEISFAPIQADPGSAVRSASEQVTVEVSEPEAAPVETTAEETSVPENPKSEPQNPNTDMDQNQNPGAPTVDAEAVRKEAIQAERQRQSDIRAAVRKAGLDEAFADDLISGEKTVDQARAAIIDKWAAKDPAAGQRSHAAVTTGKDEADKFRKAMSDALLLRANPSTKLVNNEDASVAREFRGMNLLDMARESAERAGINTKGMSRREVAQAAFGIVDGSRSYHSTSDFPVLLGDTVNRTLRAAYQERPRTFEPFVRRTTLPDFREITRAQLSGLVGDFDQISEGGEYTSGTFNEAGEKYKLAKYGKKIAVTWESIINDDLSAFDRVPAAFAARAAQKQSDIVYSILLNNPLMADGQNLFSAAHLNQIASPGTTISIDNLGNLRKLIRNQKSIEGTVLNLEPRFLVVGADLEQLALQFTSANYVPNAASGVNVWGGRLQPIIEPRITGNKWFLACDPGQVDTIETAFLDGEQEIYTEQKMGFDVDGLEIKARMVFAAKAIDHRGFAYNAGN